MTMKVTPEQTTPVDVHATKSYVVYSTICFNVPEIVHSMVPFHSVCGTIYLDLLSFAYIESS